MMAHERKSHKRRDHGSFNQANINPRIMRVTVIIVKVKE